mgnify:CR=1 FL=1
MLLSASVLFESDVDSERTPPNLTLMIEGPRAGGMYTFLGIVPPVEWFFHIT